MLGLSGKRLTVLQALDLLGSECGVLVPAGGIE